MTSNSEYRGLNQPTDNEDEDYPPQFASLLHEQEKQNRWSHIDDLDEFFTRIYQYHQNHGMPSLVLMEFLNLFQILFLACFSVFMIECVDYKTLFENQKIGKDQVTNSSFVKKTHISDVVFPLGQCVQRISLSLWLVLAVVIIFWLFRLIKAIYNITCYAEIRSFYITALNIQTKDLQNITWHEVQEKLLSMQKKHNISVQRQDLTELDIYNRILRFKNYQVAMVNQGLLVPKVTVPFIGSDLICFTNGFKYNFEFLFFWGPFAPFNNSYQLRPEYKVFSKRNDLTYELRKSILILGVMNIVLAPVIFIWQLLQFFYNYTELIKKDPALLGIRRWSNYGRLYFRHFNELDHELEARLSRAYKPANLYLSSFISHFLINIAKFFLFTFGAIFAVLVFLTVYDEDVLNVEHIITIITISGAVAGIARSMIPDESAVYFTDQMMYQILAQVHYLPDKWKVQANSLEVRDEFVKLFQFKFAYFLEELFSPLVTPFILLFWLRPRASKFVDFLRCFTVDIVGVGDVCSFSLMDTRRHGNSRWLSKTKAKKSYQARNGKTELSLIHFAHTNPHWRMPLESTAFIDQIKDQACREVSLEGQLLMSNTMIATTKSSGLGSSNLPRSSGSDAANAASAAAAGSAQNTNNDSFNKSMYHLQSLVYNSALPSNLLKSHAYSTMHSTHALQQSSGQTPAGAVSRIEGPLYTNKHERQTLLSIAQASNLQLSTMLSIPGPTVTTAAENSLDMCFSALYMHELHRKYHYGDYIDLDNVKEENDELHNDMNDNEVDQNGAAGHGGGDDDNSNTITTAGSQNNYTSFHGANTTDERNTNNDDSNQDSDDYSAPMLSYHNTNAKKSTSLKLEV